MTTFSIDFMDSAVILQTKGGMKMNAMSQNQWMNELIKLKNENDALTYKLRRGQSLNNLTTVIFCAVSFFAGMLFMGFLTRLIGG